MRRLAAAISAYKACFFAVAVCSLYLLPGIYNAGNYRANFHWPPDAPASTTTALETWDAQHYLYLAGHGYSAGGVSINFFPLWPWLIRAGSAVTGGNLLASALLLSNLLSLAGLLLFYEWGRRRAGAEAATAGLMLLIAFPGALFFSFAYSESLFLALAMLMLLSLEQKRFGRSAAAALLLPLARPQGIMVAPAYWLALWRERRSLGSAKAAVMAAAPLLGLAIYFGFMRIATGSALSGLRVYAGLAGEASPAKLFDLPGLWHSFWAMAPGHAPATSPLDRLWFAAALALLPLVARLGAVELLFALPLVLAPALLLSFVGYTRHAALLAPVFLAAGRLLAGDGKRWPRWTVLAVFQTLQALLAVMLVNNYWVG